MKKSVFLLLISFCVSFCASAKSCYSYWHVGNTPIGFQGGGCTCAYRTMDTIYTPGNPINLLLSGGVECDGGCGGQSSWFAWAHNGDTARTTTYLVTDTGYFYGFCYYLGCGPETLELVLYVKYTAVGVDEITADNNALTITPELSHNIFKIHSAKPLTLIIISDSRGRIVYMSSSGLSQIDLSDFSAGVYFYSIENENKNIFRGKILKE